ncbi:MAG: CBS domain-containing protein [Cyanothece sp. SIO1E1]|nr:CBS domain-containing protein [Cyanothece sp. SIO1E1]
MSRPHPFRSPERVILNRVMTIESSAAVIQAIALMQAKKSRSLIVLPDHTQDTYGILTERDIVYNVTACGQNPAEVSVYEIMRKPCIVVDPELSVRAVAQLLADTGIQRAPVMQDDQLLGVISVTDIVMKSSLAEQISTDTLSQKIQGALQHARIICDEQDQISQECAVAWDVVEEIQSEAAHQRSRASADH